jgi:ssDNA-binding Zn-finger/Zn-ribbon topoisomerase 1
MNIVCKCGYEGNQMVQFQTETPSKQLMEWGCYSYPDHIKWVRDGVKTLNWACPKCGRILVQQRGGLSYNQHEYEDMRRRLQHNNWAIERLHKCESCGKRIDSKDEWLSSNPHETKYYHEVCIKKLMTPDMGRPKEVVHG